MRGYDSFEDDLHHYSCVTAYNLEFETHQIDSIFISQIVTLSHWENQN